ncbi:hypothetical protein ACQP1W_29275 [Spirillospora sp. CA-255316]
MDPPISYVTGIQDSVSHSPWLRRRAARRRPSTVIRAVADIALPSGAGAQEFAQERGELVALLGAEGLEGVVEEGRD